MQQVKPEAAQLSVVVATTHPWPFLKSCLNALLPQCEKLGAELLIGDSTGKALPCSLFEKRECRIRHIPVAGSSVFELRAKAAAEANGEIIAWTEDHCRPAPDWCERILAAHSEHPEAGLIGGAVLNGSCAKAMDWANFLCTFGPFVPPFARPPRKRAPAVANLSFKRRAIPPAPIRPGAIEIICAPELLANGSVLFDDRIRVTHIQSWGFWGTFAAHFHNGRSTTGLLADTIPALRRFRQMFICLLMPAELLRTSLQPLIRKRGVPWLRHLPLMCGLAVAFSLGELAGLVTRGPGRSPHFLE
jgi:hypothetical protein